MLRMQFQTMTSLCTSWPSSFGIYCLENGAKGLIRPLSPMSLMVTNYFQNPVINPHPGTWTRSLFQACGLCPCLDIAPDEPEPASHARPTCVGEQEADLVDVAQPASSNSDAPASTSQCPATTGHGEDWDAPVCSIWYGNPVLPDCQEAVRSLHEHLLAHKQEPNVGSFGSSNPEAELDFGPHIAPFDLNFVRLGNLARLQRRWNTVTFVALPLTFTKGAYSLSSFQRR
ncbi:hypothetical protein XPA_010333 [Xanthoria parietina]